MERAQNLRTEDLSLRFIFITYCVSLSKSLNISVPKYCYHYYYTVKRVTSF